MRLVRLAWLFLLPAVWSVAFAQSQPLDQPVTLRLENVSLKQSLIQLELESRIPLSYNSRHLPEYYISQNFQATPLRKVLSVLLRGTRLDFTYLGGTVVIFPEKDRDKEFEFTISGYVQDRETGEALIGARVVDAQSHQGTLTNEAGFFSLTLPPDSVKLIVSYVGYALYGEKFFLTRNHKRVIRIRPTFQLETVLISERPDSISALQNLQILEVPLADMERLPTLMGESDLFSTLKLFPGVSSVSDGATGLYVRGGGPDQNLTLMDGVPIYNTSHLFGFYSIFNSDAIQSATLHKGGFPARYGGRLSSVIDIRLKEGDFEKFEGQAGIGLTSASLSLGGPIIRGKTSLSLSGRRTYLEPYLKPLSRLLISKEEGKLGYYFFDFNAKLTHKFDQDNKVSLTFYTGRDQYSSGHYFADGGVRDNFDFGLGWGNLMGTLQWKRIWGPKVFGTTAVSYTSYDYSAQTGALLEVDTLFSVRNELNIRSQVRDISFSTGLDIFASPRHQIRTGFKTTGHRYDPETIRQKITDNETDSSFFASTSPPVTSLESELYVEDEWKIDDKFRVNGGLHFSHFMLPTKSYSSLQPRLLAWYNPVGNFSLEAGFSTMAQYSHLLSNSGVGLPTDFWVPSNEFVPPQRSEQVSLGMGQRWPDLGLELTIDGYYKRMRDLVDYKTGVSFIGNENWEELVELEGTGRSYGIEFLLRKTKGRLNGWIGYTLSRTTRQFERINFGEPYPFKYDRRHDLSVVAIYKLSDKVELSANWILANGHRITLPEGLFFTPSLTPSLSFWDLNTPREVEVAFEYGPRNEFSMPYYHRLDLNVRFHKKTSWGEQSWNIGLYNTYNRLNPFFLYLRADYSDFPDPPKFKVRQVALLPLLPSLNYSCKF